MEFYIDSKNIDYFNLRPGLSQVFFLYLYVIYTIFTMAGLSKGMTLQDIADKHSIDIDVLKKEWKKGVKVEMEHTKDPKVAGRIAMDHLTEDPK